jgi:hypothetical protein
MSASVAEEKQLLLLTVAAAQVTKIRAATTENRRLLLEMQGCSWCRWLRFRQGGKEKRVPSTAAASLHLLPVAGAVDDATTMAGACSRCIEMDELLLILTATNIEDGSSSQLEATLLMAEDGVLLLSMWISFVVVSLMNRETAVRDKDGAVASWVLSAAWSVGEEKIRVSSGNQKKKMCMDRS